MKYAVESATGVLYLGIVATAKRPNPDTGEDTPVRPTKESKMGNETEARGAQTSAQTKAGGTGDKLQGTSSSGSSGNSIEFPIPNAYVGSAVFRHKRIVTSYANNFTYVKATWTPYTAKKQFYLTTPLACVPVDSIPWYLSPAEFNALPITSEVTMVKTKIIPYGYRLPFLIKASGLTYANAQADLIGCYGFGLNNKYNGSNFIMSYDTTQSTKPVGVGMSSTCDSYSMWGKPLKPDVTDTPNDLIIPSSVGNIHILPTYFCQNADVEGSGDYNTTLFHDLTTFQLVEKPSHSINYQYRPEVCVLKMGTPYPPTRNQSKTVYPVGAKFAGNQVISMNNNYGTTSDNSIDTDEYLTRQVIPYNSFIEQSGVVSNGLTSTQGTFMAPTLHVGVLPLDTSYSSTTDDFSQTVVAQWSCETEIQIKYNLNFTHTCSEFVTKESATFCGDVKYIKNDGHLHYWLGRPVYVDTT